MKNMIRHQTRAMPIHIISCFPIGVFHQIRSEGGKYEVIDILLIYSAMGIVAISMIPQRM